MNYVFEGDTIKLNERDFNKALRLYQNIHLMAELEQLDVELSGTQKWWPVQHAKLNYRNKVAPKRQQYVSQGNVAHLNTRDMPTDQMLTDRSWAK